MRLIEADALSPRVVHALSEACIYSLEDLTALSRDELLGIHGLWEKGADEVQRCLASRGMSLRRGMEPTAPV